MEKQFLGPISGGRVDGGVEWRGNDLFVGGERLIDVIRRQTRLGEGQDAMITFEVYLGVDHRLECTKDTGRP